MEWVAEQLSNPVVAASLAFVAGGVFTALLEYFGRERSAEKDEERRRRREERERLREIRLRRIRATRAYFDAYQDHLVEHLMEPPDKDIAPFAASRWPDRSFEFLSRQSLRGFREVVMKYTALPQGSGIRDDEWFAVLHPFHALEEDLKRAEDDVVLDRDPRILTQAEIDAITTEVAIEEAYRRMAETADGHG